MTTKTVSRNDPCPCGSGKKYKHCCRHKDREAERAAKLQAASPAPIEPPEEPPVDVVEEERLLPDSAEPKEEIDPVSDIWDEFEAADYEEEIALFYQTLDDGLMDDDMAFEMLNDLFSESVAAGERDRFDELVDALRRRAPEAYAPNIAYIMDWETTNIAASGQYERFQTMVEELTEAAVRDIDIFNYIFERLVYHGQTGVIAQVMHGAWPEIKEGGAVVEWGIGEFGMRGADFALLHYVEIAFEAGRTPDPQDPALMEAVTYFYDPDETAFANYVKLMAGQAKRHWIIEDSELLRLTDSPEEEIINDDLDEDDFDEDRRRNRWELSLQFIDYLHRAEGLSYAKAWLSREALSTYFDERAAGELDRSEENPFADLDPRRKRRSKRKKRRRKAQDIHPFCPDRASFDYYLARQFGFLTFGLYRAAVAYETVPAWLRFLESMDLIDADRRQAALDELRGLGGDMEKVFEVRSEDPTIASNIASAWNDDDRQEAR